MYARYIPPHIGPQAPVVPPRSATDTKHAREHTSKRKHSEKEDTTTAKRRRHSDKDDDQVTTPNIVETSNGDEERKSRTQALLEVDDATKDEVPDITERQQRKADRKAARRAARAISPNDEDREPASKAHARILQKFEKSAQRPEDRVSQDENLGTELEPKLRDLVPIPRPKAAAGAFAKPSFSALPPWLSEPIVIPPEQHRTFKELGLQPELLSKLAAEGFEAALPVQSGVLPLLLPAPAQHPGDVCVSAATGSGKTIAYVLPIIQSLRGRVETRLRALMVVPTRELVSQVRQVADVFTKGTDLKVGTAVGSHTLKAEQESLVSRGNKFDPDGWEELRMLLDAPADDYSHWDDPEHHTRVEEALATLPGHVPDYHSKVDILICTPGRLVDHIKNTRGFTLRDLEWLVIDEADRLLDQSFQEWSDTVNQALSRSQKVGDIKAKVPDMETGSFYGPSFRRGVRKVMLSATMTNDLSQLDALKLQNPKLVVIGRATEGDGEDGDVHLQMNSGTSTLPPTLEEHAVPVGDGSNKPLHIMRLLDTVFGRTSEFSEDISHSTRKDQSTARAEHKADEGDGNDSDASSSVVSSDSDSDSDSDSVVSSSNSSINTVSSTASTVSSNSDSSTSSSSISDSKDNEESTGVLQKEASDRDLESLASNALIFTSTNEAALRLSSLIGMLSAQQPEPYRVATITKSSNTSSTRSTLQAFNNGNMDILVASDRIARGLDLPALSTVINYDVPRSTTSYVHRAGRTARAGRHGTVWTLIEKHEARWFWKEIGSVDSNIQRPRRGGVRKRKLAGQDTWGEQAKEQYIAALERLKQDVGG